MKTRPEQLRAAIALATLCAAIGVATVPAAQAQQWSPRRPGHSPAQPDQRPRPNRHDIRTFWDEFEEAKAADATARVPRAKPARAVQRKPIHRRRRAFTRRRRASSRAPPRRAFRVRPLATRGSPRRPHRPPAQGRSPVAGRVYFRHRGSRCWRLADCDFRRMVVSQRVARQ